MLTAKIRMSDRTTVSAWCAPGSRMVMDTYVVSDYPAGYVFKSEVEVSRFQHPITTTGELVEHLRSLYLDMGSDVVTEGF